MSSLMELLERESVTKPAPDTVENINPLRRELGEKARKMFGYSGLLTQQKVVEALADLGINPYSQASVEKYQARMLRKKRPLHSGFGAAGVLVGIGVLYLWALLRPDPVFVIWPTVAFTVISVYLLFRAMWRYYDWQWVRVPLDSTYRGPAADFAIDTAVRVKELIPEARFFIEELRDGSLVDDPFLVMTLGNQTYYLEVWDESAFHDQK
jgi:hypothetical protein